MFAYVTIFQQAGQLQGIAEPGDGKQSGCVPWLSAFDDTEIPTCGEKPGCCVLKSCLFKTAQRCFWGWGGKNCLGKGETSRVCPSETNKNPPLRLGTGWYQHGGEGPLLRNSVDEPSRISCLPLPAGI